MSVEEARQVELALAGRVLHLEGGTWRQPSWRTLCGLSRYEARFKVPHLGRPVPGKLADVASRVDCVPCPTCASLE